MVEEKKTREQLEIEGWQLASVSGGEHLKRTLEMYRELGLEIYTEEVVSDQCGECTSCYQASGEKAFKIYTRAESK